MHILTQSAHSQTKCIRTRASEKNGARDGVLCHFVEWETVEPVSLARK